ncbi:PDR/VanB family oxidoreductase [Nocardia alni]|uniref:PDR/VanB family oxidoreductase n=1 Tax=Nocardia alni TaxID=2815723 RepID=UPI001C2197F7|nr:PDR/VanB family oxidoreductase [Nocardia alni]
MGNSTRALRVQQKSWEAEGVTAITLVDPAGADLPGWEPGAHLALHLPNGMVREYSLCSDPADARRWTVAVLRKPDSRGGSSHIHDALPVGALIDVDGPRNAFSLEQDAAEHILVAGGIGITPIISMVRCLERQGRRWRLLYTGRSRSTMAFLDEITELPADRVTVHADDEADGAYPDIAGLLAHLPPTALVYCCGPEPLMTACGAALTDPTRIRLERFKAPESATATEMNAEFDVVIATTGQRVHVDASTSVLDALEAAGIPMASSCTEGICGTCEVAVVRGDIDHRDFVLGSGEQASGTTMLPCVSRCRSAELVLDL